MNQVSPGWCLISFQGCPRKEHEECQRPGVVSSQPPAYSPAWPGGRGSAEFEDSLAWVQVLLTGCQAYHTCLLNLGFRLGGWHECALLAPGRRASPAGHPWPYKSCLWSWPTTCLILRVRSGTVACLIPSSAVDLGVLIWGFVMIQRLRSRGSGLLSGDRVLVWYLCACR